ncbi:PucR family transcriptional regulator [Specibacter cremeus]|uniref:PucR family transcriptional regulator n=1 Tax=Specibacter cremeus TaxID=1629051 RepID=UPI000F7B1B1D|nr:PucR family transcriptional regulator [Specibacter cremeus]
MNLEGHVQAYADRIQAPIVVFNSDFKVVAFSVHDQDIDHSRLAIILSHKGSPRARASIREYHVDQADGPAYIPPLAGRQARHVAPLRHDGRITGYLSHIPEGAKADLPPEDDRELRETRRHIGLILAAMALGNREGTERSLHLLTALLEGDAEKREQAADELLTNALVSSVPHYAVITLAATPGESPGAAVLQLALDKALSTIPKYPALRAEGAVINDEAVLVVPYEIEMDRLNVLLALPTFTGLRAGVGGRYASLAEAYRSHREARIARRGAVIDPERSPAARWEALGLDRLLLQLPLESLSMKDVPETVQRLFAAQSGLDLAQTLEAYLDCGCDAQRTAKELHVHRSTLYYRLDRIREIVIEDLSDGRVRRELHTGLRLAALAGLR